MIIQVDLDAPTPAYEQVREQLAAYIDAGILNPGDLLPSIRQLSKDLGIATNTVQRAYRELETGGVIKARGRHGTVVLPRTDAGASGGVVTSRMRDAADRLAREALASGGGIDDVVRAARTAFLALGDTAGPAVEGGSHP